MLTLLKIGAVNLLLSSDNVLVIALFGRSLAKTRRRAALGLSLLASVALSLGILFAVAWLFRLWFLKSLFGLLIATMAVKLLRQKREKAVAARSDSLWTTVGQIVTGNLMMSFENEAALITLAQGNVWVAWLAVVVTSPVIFFGSHLMTWLLGRYDFILYVGSVLLMKIGVGLVFTLAPIRPVASPAGWVLTGLYALGVLWVYLSRHHLLPAKSRSRV